MSGERILPHPGFCACTGAQLIILFFVGGGHTSESFANVGRAFPSGADDPIEARGGALMAVGLQVAKGAFGHEVLEAETREPKRAGQLSAVGISWILANRLHGTLGQCLAAAVFLKPPVAGLLFEAPSCFAPVADTLTRQKGARDGEFSAGKPRTLKPKGLVHDTCAFSVYLVPRSHAWLSEGRHSRAGKAIHGVVQVQSLIFFDDFEGHQEEPYAATNERFLFGSAPALSPSRKYR